MPDFKLLPMGISDFRRIRLENYYYVDKTEWIPTKWPWLFNHFF